MRNPFATAQKSGIFVSYRRDDAGGDAGRLADDLQEYFGRERIFRDIENIDPGLDFVKAINKEVGSCAVLLALIGPHWLTVADKSGRRRIDDPNDYVALEIRTALSGDIRVIPVLVRDAKMPSPEELPPGLAEFAHRQSYPLSDRNWKYDISQLVAALQKIPGLESRPQSERLQPGGLRFWTGKRIAWALGIAVLFALIVASQQESPPPWPAQAPFQPSTPTPYTPASSQPAQLYCCDMAQVKRCTMAVALPVGSSCFCPNQGTGVVCQ